MWKNHLMMIEPTKIKLLSRLSRSEKFRQFIRFGIVGTVSSAIHYGVYCLVLHFTNANIAFTAGYGVGLICNFFLTSYFTFSSRPSSGKALGFGISHLINYILEISLLNLFLWMGTDKFIAPILVMAIVVPVNFLLLRFVFTHKRK